VPASANIVNTSLGVRASSFWSLPTDAHHFDRLARTLSTRPSRRRLLGGLAKGTLAVLGGGSAAADVAAARNRRRGKPDHCRSGRDPDAVCGGGKCACLTTRSGKKGCADIFNVECPTTDQCDRDADCPGRNNLCFVVEECCNSPRNLCARRCDTGGTNATAASGGGIPLLRRP
jgi:hypothetical protein